MTLGFCDAWANDLDGDTERALADARARMIDLGATIKSVGLPDPLELGELSNIVTMTEAAAIHSDWLRERPDEYGPQIRSRLRQGMIIPGTIYLRAIEMRAALLGDVMRTAFAGCDALMLPAVPFAPPRAADMDGTSTGGAIGTAIPQMVAAMARFTRPISYLGLPGLSLPIGRSGSDLPIGMQLVGRPFDEAGILSIGIAFERAGGVRRRLPSSL
jgi:aspartyl-tRNA(Asn)/glutamyl-tRNA(Gln) amidotransferase subunit A